uniref:CooT family nickel-binding protein n=1 Tax=Thermofilum pendens TaxID=2269 RepID=A0A7C3SKT5_THEPE
MCESKVIVRSGEGERSFEEVVELVAGDGVLTVVCLDGSRYKIPGRIVRLEANFVKHSVLVVLE